MRACVRVRVCACVCVCLCTWCNVFTTTIFDQLMAITVMMADGFMIMQQQQRERPQPGSLQMTLCKPTHAPDDDDDDHTYTHTYEHACKLCLRARARPVLFCSPRHGRSNTTVTHARALSQQYHTSHIFMNVASRARQKRACKTCLCHAHTRARVRARVQRGQSEWHFGARLFCYGWQSQLVCECARDLNPI